LSNQINKTFCIRWMLTRDRGMAPFGTAATWLALTLLLVWPDVVEFFLLIVY